MGKARTGGILILVGAILSLVLGIIALAVVLAFQSIASGLGDEAGSAYAAAMTGIYITFGLALVASALGIVGGLMAMKGKKFGLAIVGAKLKRISSVFQTVASTWPSINSLVTCEKVIC